MDWNSTTRPKGDESIDQLGISIQQLGRKAFPSIVGKDFDRLLKGHFYQTLLVKWQWKLGAPKPDESFHDLLLRARMLEEHEKQYQASAESRSEKAWRISKSGTVDSKRSAMHKKAEQCSSRTNLSQKTTEPNAAQKQESALPTRVKERRCFLCQGTGHYKRDCPNR